MKFIICLAFILSSFSISYACSCAVSATEQGQIKDIENLETIFYGKVISVGKDQRLYKEQGLKYENNGEFSYNDQKIRLIKFKVLKIWKGIIAEEIIVGADAEVSCGLSAEVGDKFIIATDKRKVLNTLTFIDYCSTEINKTLLRKVYGEGEIVKAQKPRQKNVSEFVLSTVQKFIFFPA